MRVFVLLCVLCLCVSLRDASAQTSKKRAASKLDAKVVTRLEGPGGSVGLGDSLQLAKKAFPPPKGAQVAGASNFAIFARDGWSWSTESPLQAFEVSLKNGKIVDIAWTTAPPNAQSRKVVMDETAKKIGKPSASTEGKTATLYAWDIKPNARFVMNLNEGVFSSGPFVMTIIGDQTDLKTLNYRVDDVVTLVKQMDLSAEAMKKMDKKKQ